MKRTAPALLVAALVLGTGTASASTYPDSTDRVLNAYVNIGEVDQAKVDTANPDSVLLQLDARRQAAGRLAQTLVGLKARGCDPKVLRDIWAAGITDGTRIALALRGKSWSEDIAERCTAANSLYDDRDYLNAYLIANGVLTP